MLIAECEGSLNLLTSEGTDPFKLTPEHYFSKKRNKPLKFRKIKVKNPNRPPKYRVFEKATLIGNCCWRAWDSYSRDGMSFSMSTAETFEPGWRIATVELIRDCSLLQ